MKVKRVKIGIHLPGTIFAEAAEVVGQIEAGKKVRTQGEWLYFSDVREMGKVLTPKRLELLKTIREHHPESVRAVAELTGRNVKNVAEDLALLASLGLVEMKESDYRREGNHRPTITEEKANVGFHPTAR